MGSHFSWQTEDDSSWDELPTPPRPQPPRRRFWLWAVLVLAAAILTPLIIYNRLQKQVETATAQARDDVIAAHTLSQHAAANQDTDLFRSNLSRHDPYWADVQRELVSRGLYLDRSAFGLVWWAESALNQANPVQPISLTLSPDLLTAHITYEQEYRLTDPLSSAAASNQTIRLQHTDIYRRGEDRWLRADPLDDFWGALEEVEHTYLTVQYNARDAAIATRLAEDLNGQLSTVCQTFAAVNCDDLHLTLLLSRDPAYFFTVLDLEDIVTTGDILRLPSPTLVGMPLEDVGYQFLLRGYAVPLVSLAITRLTRYECCDRGLFFRAFLDKELHRLNLGPWPLTPDRYATLDPATAAASVLAAWDVESLLGGQSDAYLPVYSLVDFLTEATRPQLDITYWQSSLRPGMSYWSWIEPRLLTTTSPGLFNTRWLNYIEQQRQAIPPPPIRLPEGELQISCMGGTIHYQPASNSWSESNQTTSAIIRTIPGGYLAQAVAYQGDARSLLMVQNNHTTVITSTNQADIVYGPSFFTQPYPWFHFTTIDLTTPETRPQDWLVNLDSCKEGECDLRPLRGIPIFSPDGQNMLVLVDGLGTGSLDDIYLTTPTAPTMRQVGRGYGWFWLDNEHFAFFYDFTNRIEMYIGQTDGSTPRHVFTNSDLSGFFPEAHADSPYHINWISPRPQAPHETLLWMTYTGSPSYELVFQLTWDDTWQTIVDTNVIWEGERAVPSFSPDGRFYLFDQQGPNRALILRDIASGAEQIYAWGQTRSTFFSTPLWLDDGRWLVYLNDTELTLIAPHENYARRIPHALTNCNYAIYLPPGEPPDMRGR